MAKEIRTEIEINAPASRIWEILMDFEEYGTWNQFIQSIKTSNGPIEVGSQLEAVLQIPKLKPMTIKPKVKEHEEDRKLVWLGRTLLPKIFDGEHHFEIIPLDDSISKFVHKERFSGILVPLFLKFYGESTREGFELMNQSLKERAERS